MTAADEDLLARVVAGDLDPESQVWKAALARDPALAARWQELTLLLGALDRTGADERETLARARAETTSNDFARLRNAADGTRKKSAAGDWWRRPLLVYLAAGAAVVIGAFFALNRDGSRSPNDPTYLGESDYVCLEPTLEVGDARSFRWSGERAPAGDFVVRVFAVEATGSAGKLVLESPPCIENSWRPTPDELALVPETFLWEVEARRAGGALLELSAPQLARRSRP
ncbi:MAG: hypothetical protein IT453_03960 [Planctomycetes bacterium]|nr:hypothetical protein [Planctomycetota bacterium]